MWVVEGVVWRVWGKVMRKYREEYVQGEEDVWGRIMGEVGRVWRVGKGDMGW